MKPVEPAELSAFLDNELDGVRAAEVEAALASDSALRAEFNAVARADAECRSAAGTAAFSPDVRLSAKALPSGPWYLTAAVVGVLVAVRMLPKFSDALEFGFVLHGLALVIVLAWVTWIARSAGGHSRMWPKSQ
jgi:anti-sigma factor RsiW